MKAQKQNTNQKSKKWIQVIIIALLVLLVGLVGYGVLFKKDTNDDQLAVDTTQSEYVEPEKPMDRSKNVTLPGWASFTIPANEKTVSEGFEFHNPGENYWYVDSMSIKGKNLEDLVVDSGNVVELNHYLKLAKIESSVKSVKSYDKDAFKIKKNDDGEYTVEAVKGFEGNKNIVVETENGKEVTIKASGKTDLYYMTFALYLEDGDELLYQSGLVAPGKYIQKMDMNKSLKKGSYKAYVVCQPYRSDKKTKTNTGRINLTLNVQ